MEPAGKHTPDLTLGEELKSTDNATADPWFVCGSHDFVLAVTGSAKEAGIVIAPIEPADVSKIDPGKLVIFEFPGGDGAAAEAAAHGVVVIAVLDEPTIDWFTKAIHAGARDVLAGAPTAQTLAAHGEKWKAKIAHKK